MSDTKKWGCKQFKAYFALYACVQYGLLRTYVCVSTCVQLRIESYSQKNPMECLECLGLDRKRER